MEQQVITSVDGKPLDLSKRKIGIAFPSPDTIPVEFHHCLMQMITATAQHVSLGLTNSASSRIAKNRISIVENARLLGATDLLFIDSDSIFPVHALMTLIMQDKDIVCATTCRRKGNDMSPVAVPADYASITPGQRMVKMKQIGFPFMLIKMSVFDKLDELGVAPDHTYFAEPPRWMTNKYLNWDVKGDDELMGEDEYFCQLVLRAGYDIWCDMGLSMEIGHIGYQVRFIENPPAPPKLDDTLMEHAVTNGPLPPVLGLDLNL